MQCRPGALGVIAALLKRGNGGDDTFQSRGYGKTYSAEHQLSGMLLKEVIKEAEQNLGQKIDSAVIHIPAYFITTISRERPRSVQENPVG